MTEHGSKMNGTWSKITICVMGAVTLFSSGWAASSTTAWMDVKRIDSQGTQKTQQLEVRVQKLETTVEVTLRNVQETLRQIQLDLRQHTGISSNGNRVQSGG